MTNRIYYKSSINVLTVLLFLLTTLYASAQYTKEPMELPLDLSSMTEQQVIDNITQTLENEVECMENIRDFIQGKVDTDERNKYYVHLPLVDFTLCRAKLKLVLWKLENEHDDAKKKELIQEIRLKYDALFKSGVSKLKAKRNLCLMGIEPASEWLSSETDVRSVRIEKLRFELKLKLQEEEVNQKEDKK